MEIPKNITGSFLNQVQSRTTESGKVHKQNLSHYRRKYYHAVELARQGHYTDAELLLIEFGNRKEFRAIVLDIRAKMFAQQNRFSEAEACWLEALSLNPGNQQYRKALDTLTSNGQYAIWTRLALITLVIAVSTIGVFAVFMMGLNLSANRYNNLQRQFAEYEQKSLVSVKRLSQKVDMLEKVSANNQKNLEKHLNSLASSQQQILESEKKLVASINWLSQKISSLEKESTSLENTMEEQSANSINLKNQITNLEKNLAVSIGTLSQKLDLLEEEKTIHQNIYSEQSNSHEGLLAGFGKVLFAPIDFVFNLGKKEESHD